MEIAGVGRAILRTRGIGVFSRPHSEYSLEAEESVVVRVPWIFSTVGLAKWQFGFVGGEGRRLEIAASPVKGFDGTRLETVGLERPDPRCLAATDSAGFPVLIRAMSLGSPLLSLRVARELEGASESLRLLVVMAAVWERMRYEGPGD